MVIRDLKILQYFVTFLHMLGLITKIFLQQSKIVIDWTT